MRFPLSQALFQFTLLLLISQSTLAQVYQWKDAGGKTHYGDQVPPENSTLGHKKLDRAGQTVKNISPQKTPDQIRIEQKLAEEAAERERLRQLQATRDRALMVTFAHVTQLDKLRDERVKLLDSTIRVVKSKIRKIESQLEQAENRKFQYVSKDRTPPKQLQANINEYEKQLVNHYEQIALNQQRRQKILEKFAADRTRFLELQAQHSAN